MEKEYSAVTKMPDIRVKIRIAIVLGIINVLLGASYLGLTHYADRKSVV